jgi:hypothetical protein
MVGIWHPDAVICAGPVSKTGENPIFVRNGRGAVLHSMEGYMRAALDRLDNYPDDSWHFSVPKQPLLDGPFYQHYPIVTVCWHAGSAPPNLAYFGIEHEGVVGESLTEHQIDCDVAILTWAFDNDMEPWPGFIRRDTLWEHRELYATACPSGRIPWDEVINMSMLFERFQARLSALETGNAWQQGVLNALTKDTVDLKTGQGWISGGLNLLKARVDKLTGK